MVWVMNMSKEYCCFKSESGETAFLAGVVDVLSDNLSLHCAYSEDLDADIFYTPDQDLSQLTDAVKNRMRSYYSLLGGLNEPEKIEALDFDDLVRVDCNSKSYMTHGVPELRDNKAAKDANAEFMRELEWHLGKPICTYSPSHLPDKNIEILGRAYMSFARHYYFIAFEEYMVLMIFGTSE